MIPKEEIRKNLEDGLPILIYDFDGREEETDMMFYAGVIDWKKIYILRKEAGGLICYATGSEEGKKLGLKFQTDILLNSEYKQLVKLPQYGDKPAFSLWVNHVNTRTGISDNDRALTILKLHEIISELKKDEKSAVERFYTEFYAPGHVPILLSRGIGERHGHTELSTTLAEYVGLERSVVIAEMLDEGKSLSKEKVIQYARNIGFLLIEGKEILKEVIA
ncbi:3,4-dihydroxy-2-butanone-4-phosphate synthase [Acidianus ambivalens]|uniref:3,4-dihydroxy-2-butanone 4-phosphate synthase n=1 Tax=Acidianus ambivalens TaxID=2283 RepID=A0A650CXG9_ACIAM|nr:3,4-dihydroxy-2-butanone-4-phosphate synthase [Acidianus ambivalens]MQL54717.1 3,4-dihydroxy-2-butanone 4-phosphate synthase [Acidianus ambivalens]QGR22513.1 3,4-dihydroxy-2-butanone 4-phosphate synthase [Acidianus ambivalens]